MKRPLPSTLLALLAALGSASAVPIQVSYTDTPGTGFFDPTPRAAVGGNNGATLGEQRRIAFEFAAKRWSEQISGTIPIKITVSFAATLPAGDPPKAPFLATARPQDYLSNPAQGGPLPVNDTFYPTALANQLFGEDTVVSGTSNDVIVSCNAYYENNGTESGDNRRWYYGLDANPALVDAGGTEFLPDFDFVVVALHEIGHGLGFTSHIDTDGSYFFGKAAIWNRLMKNGTGTAITALSPAGRAAARTSDDVFIASPNVLLFNNGSAAKVHAPNPFAPGSSMSHFDEETYSETGSLNELMTPVSSFGTQNLGPLVLNSLRDMGYAMLDQLPPTVAITTPVAGKSYRSGSLLFFGNAEDASSRGSANAAGLLRVKIALSNAAGEWYSWTGGGFAGTVFNNTAHTKEATIASYDKIATGSKSWSTSLPAGLPDGFYQVHAAAVDQLDQGSQFVATTFTLDNAAPAAQIEPWANNDVVFNLEGFRVFAPEAQSMEVEIRRLDGAITWFWTGTNWSTTSFTLPATTNAGRWSVNAALPGRNSWPAAQPIVLFARATDAALNVTTTQIQVTRTAADITGPLATLASPATGTVLTGQSMPAISGTASDPESGIASLTLTLSRFLAGGGVDFWNGAGWGASPVNLTVQFDAVSGNWSAPFNWNLPSGSALTNGGYALQITATNRETPAATIGVGGSFSVDYHPTYTWTGYTMRDSNPDNNSSSWGVPENWSPYGVPSSGDIAIIDNGDTVTSTVSRNVYGLKLSSSTLSFNNGPGPQGTVTTTDDSEWNGGTLHGIWEVASGSTLSLAGAGERQLSTSSQLINGGTVIWNSGTTKGYDSATITNLPGGLWILAGAGDAFSLFYGGNRFINQGTLRHSSAVDIEFNDWAFTLGGEIQKHGGVLVSNAPVTIPNGTQFTNSGGYRHIGSTLTLPGTVSNPAGLFEIAGGTLHATTPATLSGIYRWSAGGWSGNFTIPAGSELFLTGTCQLNTSAVLNNAGTVHWDSASPLHGYDSVTVNNLPGGIWRLERGGDAFSQFYGGHVFNNQGLLEKTAAGDTFLRHWAYTLPGQTHTSAGTLRIEATSTLPAGAVLSGAGTLDLAAGGCSLNGEINSTVATFRLSGGTLNAAAGAKIQGNWHWTGGNIGGSLEIPVTRQLTINGTCQLNTSATLTNKGTVIWDGGIPLKGYDSVTVTNAAGATWEFASAGDAFSLFYGGNHFHNLGLLKRSAASGIVLLDEWTYHHTGTFNATAATTQINAPLNLLAGGSFTGAGSFTFHGDTRLKGSTTFTADSSVAAGTFSGEAAGLVNGMLRWSSGTFYGTTKVAAGSYLRLATTGGKTLATNSDLDVSGELAWEQGDLTGYDTSKFIIRSGGLFRITGSGALNNFQGGNRVVVESGASFVKSSAGDSTIHWAFDNDGSVAVNAGVLVMNGGGLSAGLFTGDGGGIARFAAGGQVLEAGASLVGGIEVTGGSLVASGHASGRLDVIGGTAGSTAPAVFSFTNGSTWTGGSLTGITSVPNGASLTVSGPTPKSFGTSAAMSVAGLLQWEGGQPIQGYDSATLTIATGGLFRVTADGDLFSNFYGGNRLLLSGTLEKTAGTTSTLLDDWLVEGGGTIRPAVAKIDFQTNVNLLPGTQFEGAGQTRFNAGTTTVRGVATLQPVSAVHFTGASINGHADASGGFNGGSIDWSAGWLNGLLTLNSTTLLSGSSQKWIGTLAQIRNAGQMTLAGSGTLMGHDTSTLRNLAGGILTCTGSHHLGNYYGSNRLINEGTMNLGAPFGRQTVDWKFEQSASGTLALEVSGENAATPQFDILHVTGGIQLGGKLTAVKTGGYVPAEATPFPFLTGSGITGTFATVQAPGFSLEYSAASALLRAGNTGVGFEDWAETNGLEDADSLSGADPDHDGVENFLEYAFNTDPNVHTPSPVTSATMNLAGQDWVVVKYRRWQDRIDAGLGYFPERSAALAAWNTTGMVDEADPDEPAVEGSEARRCRILLGSGKDFLRLRVE